MRLFKLILIIYIFIFAGCNNRSKEMDSLRIIKPDSVDSTTVSPPIKGICIFVGQAETFNDADWQAIADSPVTDFIIIPKEAEYYGATEKGYKEQLAPFIAKVVNEIVSRDNTVKIWVGTPGISSLNFELAASSLEPIYNYLSFCRQLIGNTTWNTNIGGVYMNQESVYGEVDFSNIDSNSCIKLMTDLSNKVHKDLNTKFLWIPYYGYGTYSEKIIKQLGYVVNTTDIFDYVVIQPHYYFDETIPENLLAVRQSILKQAVCYHDGIPVIAKTSKTIVGAEVELSWKVVPPNNYADDVVRYNEYVSAFSEFKDIYPIIFYWDGAVQDALKARINPFFQE